MCVDISNGVRLLIPLVVLHLRRMGSTYDGRKKRKHLLDDQNFTRYERDPLLGLLLPPQQTPTPRDGEHLIVVGNPLRGKETDLLKIDSMFSIRCLLDVYRVGQSAILNFLRWANIEPNWVANFMRGSVEEIMTLNY